jgi:hypothetical protein
MKAKVKPLPLRFTEATDEVRVASIKKRKSLRLNTTTGREQFLEDVVQRHDIWGTRFENYFRLKALCIMKRKETSIV